MSELSLYSDEYAYLGEHFLKVNEALLALKQVVFSLEKTDLKESLAVLSQFAEDVLEALRKELSQEPGGKPAAIRMVRNLQAKAPKLEKELPNLIKLLREEKTEKLGEKEINLLETLMDALEKERAMAFRRVMGW